MSAISEINKIGILAGGGEVPLLLAQACQRAGLDVFIIVFAGQGRLSDFADYPHEEIALGQAGSVFKALRENHVSDIVLIGSIHKPSWRNLKPDWAAAKFLLRHGYSALGDHDLLSALRRFFEGEGFSLHGAHKFMPELVMPVGSVTNSAGNEFEADIRIGIAAALDWGRKDKGQAVLVHHGEVIAREERAGTDTMILAHGRGGAVLVKMCKPQQDRDLDLPTIGVQTVKNAVEMGLAGIAVHAGASYFLNRDEAVALADEAEIFVVGVKS